MAILAGGARDERAYDKEHRALFASIDVRVCVCMCVQVQIWEGGCTRATDPVDRIQDRAIGIIGVDEKTGGGWGGGCTK